MQDIRSAIATVLSADPTILSYLGAGAASIVSERDLISDDNPAYPVIAVSYQGTRPLGGRNDVTTEEWTIRVYNQNKGYATIDLAKNRCKRLLHNQAALLQASIPAQYDLGRSVLGCQFVWWTPEYYDIQFHAENSGVRFRVTIQETSYLT